VIAALILALGVWCCGDGYRIPWENAVPPVPNRVWDDSTRIVSLTGGRGETVAFQVVFPPGPRQNVVAAGTDLFAGERSAPGEWSFFYERAIEVVPKRLSVLGRLGAGWYREQLWPLGDGVAFDSTHSEAIWVDLRVPHVPPGVYVGSVAFILDGVPEWVTVRIRIHDFTIEQPALPFAVGFSVQKLEQVTHGPWHETITPFLQMARDHHIDLLIRGWPDLYPDTPIQWAKHDEVLGPWIPDAKAWLLPVIPYYRLPYVAVEDSLMLGFRFQHVERHWREKGWPLSRAITWIYDEPRVKAITYGGWCDYPLELLAYAQALRAQTDSIRIMVTERPDTALVATCDVLASKADLCRPGPGRWPYQTYDGLEGPALPLCVIDAPATAFRIWPWIAARYKLEGMFYWSGNSWSTYAPIDMADGNPQANGDGNGTLFWCDPESGLTGSSLRMKAIRRGMQDYAILEMARKQGQSLVVQAILSGTVRKGLYQGSDWLTAPETLDARVEVLRGKLR